MGSYAWCRGVVFGFVLVMGLFPASADESLEQDDGYFTLDRQVFDVGETVVLTAGQDEDQEPNDYLWRISDGRELSGPNQEIQFTQAGVYRVSLVTVREEGEEAADPYTHFLFINDPSDAPNAEPLPNLENPGTGDMFALNDPIAYAGYGYDYDDEDEVTVYWDFDDGTVAEGEEGTKCFSYPGHYVVRLYVRDSKGFTNPVNDEAVIYIYESERPYDGVILEPERPDEDQEELGGVIIRPNQPRLFRGGPAEGVPSGSYSGRWVFEDDQDNVVLTLEGLEVEAIFTEEQELTALFYLVDQLNSERSDPIPDYRNLLVVSNVPPDVDILEPGFDVQIEVGDAVPFAAEVEEFEGELATVAWNFSDGRRFSGERIDEVPFPETGLFWVEAVATDSGGASGAATRIYINVLPENFEESQAPTFSDYSPDELQMLGPERFNFFFSALAVDAAGAPAVEYLWDFDNGTTSTQATPGNVNYTRPGEYYPRVFARGANGIWTLYPQEWRVVVFDQANIPPITEIIQPALVPSTATDFFTERTLLHDITQPLVLEGAAADLDGDLPLQVGWFLELEDFDDESSETPFSTALKPEPLVFPGVGWYELELEACDSRGACEGIDDFRIVQVYDARLTPEVEIVEPDGDYTVAPGDPVYFEAVGYDPNDLDMTFVWDFGPNASPSTWEGREAGPIVFNTGGQSELTVEVSVSVRTPVNESAAPALRRLRIADLGDSDFEPNNNFSEAKPLTRGVYDGLVISDDDPLDYFLFNVDQDGRDFRLELDSPEAFLVSVYAVIDGAPTTEPIDVFTVQNDTVLFEDVDQGDYLLVFSLLPAKQPGKRNLSYGLTVTTLQPQLYLPFLVEDGSVTSNIGLVNVHSQDAEITIVGLDGQGKTVEQRTLTLKGKQRLYQPALNFFGSERNVKNAVRIKWVKVLSTRRLVGFVNAETRDKSQLMSVGASRSLQSEVIVPHIAARTEQWYTRAIVVNGGEQTQSLDFSASQQQTEIGQNPASSQTDFRFREKFSALPEWGRFKDRDGRPSISGIEVFGRVDGAKQMAGLEMVLPRAANPNFLSNANTIYFTHVAADTVNFWTGIALINAEAVTAGYNLYGYNQNGEVVASLLGQRLEPNGKLLNTVQGLFGADHGIAWIKVEADSSISGFELFGDPAGKRLAGFPAVENLTNHLCFPHLDIQAGKRWTGISLLNVGEIATTVTLTAYAGSGAKLAETTRLLEPRAKLVALPETLFTGGLPANAAYLEVQSDRKTINGFQLFGTLGSNGLGEQFAGLPAQTQ